MEGGREWEIKNRRHKRRIHRKVGMLRKFLS